MFQMLHTSTLEDILRNETDERKNTFVSNLLYEKTEERKAIQADTFEEYYFSNVDLAIKRASGFAPSD